MPTTKESNTSGLNGVIQDEDEIFKSLSHKIRREIIKILGNSEKSTFTEIKNQLDDIDSPSLSYHLKSLKKLLLQKDGYYELNDIGIGALMLMDRIDQSERLEKSKKKFVTANIVTICCWSLILFLVPFTITTWGASLKIIIIISIILNLIAQINYQIIFRLWRASYHPIKKKRNSGK